MSSIHSTEQALLSRFNAGKSDDHQHKNRTEKEAGTKTTKVVQKSIPVEPHRKEAQKQKSRFQTLTKKTAAT